MKARLIYLKMEIEYKKNNSGFTLLEMLVSLGIFTVVAVIAVGSLVKITSLNRRAQSLQTSMTNINYALESISREMRVGGKFDCDNNNGDVDHPGNSSNTGQSCRRVVFKSANIGIGNGGECNLVHVYGLKHNNGNGDVIKLEKAEQKSCDDNIRTTDFYSILDDSNITLSDKSSISVYKNDTYAIATIRLVGTTGVATKDQNAFDIQTSVSQRISD